MIRIEAVCIDAHDPVSLGRFWAAVLNWELTEDADGDAILTSPAGSPAADVAASLDFFGVPEGKTVKNRLHLDLRPDDQEAEVARLEGLGARRVSVGQGPEVSWVVLADPEGNEFCVLRALRPGEVSTPAG
jgi:predicted enzyme related to lactoylglutathione lyase